MGVCGCDGRVWAQLGCGEEGIYGGGGMGRLGCWACQEEAEREEDVEGVGEGGEDVDRNEGWENRDGAAVSRPRLHYRSFYA